MFTRKYPSGYEKLKKKKEKKRQRQELIESQNSYKEALFKAFA